MNWRILLLALITLSAVSLSADVIINEIMYNTPGNDNEWVELYNDGEAAVDLEGWWMVDDDEAHTALVFPSGYSIAVGEYFTVAISHHELADPFPFTPDFDWTDVSDWNLGNGTDEVNLYDQNDVLVDQVIYDDGDPWPTAPDGEGPSLELIDPEMDNSLATSWQASYVDGGTPGEANSQAEMPILTIEPSFYDFETVEAGETYEVTLTLYNTGTQQLSLEGVEYPSDEFDLNELDRNLDLPQTIEAGESITAVLSLDPNDPVRDYVFEDVITFTGNFETVEFEVSYTIVTESVGIVINEIMYNSLSYDNEWVELYNDSNDAVDLEGWYMIDDDETHTALVFPAGTTIAAGEYFTIALYHDPQASEFPFTPDYDATEIIDWNLNNTTDTINLYGPDDNLEDVVTYADSGEWPTLPDGNGPSLELIDPTYDNNLAASWQASADDGGSPGEENSGGGQFIEVSTIAELRAQEQGSNIYRLTGEAIIIFQQDWRGQKWIQDETGGVLIDDNSGIVATEYNLWDGMTNVTGTITEYGGLIEFQPTEDPGAASSTGNVIVPEAVTLAQLTSNFDDYESELIQVIDLEFADTGTFANGTVYSVTDPSGTFNFRTTFYDADYIGSEIPQSATNVTCIPNSRTDGDYISARYLSDFGSEGPALTVSPSSIAFGAVLLNETEMESFSMINSGTEDVTISSITTQSAIFTITADEEGNTFTFPITIEPGNVELAYVWFTPEEVTNYTDQVTIGSNIDDVVVNLSGSGSAGLANVVINEIMYNPSGDQGDDDYYEFIELYNNEEYEVDLSGWNFPAGIEFTFDSGVTLGAGAYLIIAKDPTSIEEYWNITGVYGPYSGNLGNSGELVQLADADGAIADYVEYLDVAPWPTGPDGNGPSLELIDPTYDNSLAENWQASSDLGGTPGAVNSDGGQLIEVANLGELRQQETGSNVYVVTGEIILTYQQEYRYQKYFQDDTGAILIDDFNGILATAYNLYDGITGLTGTITEYGGMLEFQPTLDPGAATSTGNEITPQMVTLAEFNADFDEYEGELITIAGLSFTDTGVFENGTEYEVTDNSRETATFRTTFYDVDYIGTDIPLVPRNVTCIPNSRTEGNYLTARMESDFGDVGNNENDLPANQTILAGNYPNPFNPTTTVRFALKDKSNVTIKVYNIKGQLVKTLVDGKMSAGTHEVVWEGQDNRNRSVGSGVYMFRMVTPEYEKTIKSLLLK